MVVVLYFTSPYRQRINFPSKIFYSSLLGANGVHLPLSGKEFISSIEDNMWSAHIIV